MQTVPKKLIEVALPLDAINAASAREKSIRHGHPSTLHLWWARRPLAAARAVIFAQMVDDPSSHPDLFPTAEAQEQERQRLFRLIEQLVLWENTTNETVLQQARDEIWQSWRRTCALGARPEGSRSLPAHLFNPDKLPAFHDPFAGGGSLPLEAQRLGLESYASDLNPVAVLINKAMIEIPPKFAGRPPVNPGSAGIPAGKDREPAGRAPGQGVLIPRTWQGAQGLAADVRYYGQWMRDEAEKRIGHLYPKITITPAMAQERPDLQPLVGQVLTVIAWLWARTVKSPNPAFAHVAVPLASTFMLSTKTGKEAWVEPVIEADRYRFVVQTTESIAISSDKKGSINSDVSKPPVTAKTGTKLGGSGSSFFCLLSNTPISFDFIRSEAKEGRMGAKLMAIVAEGDRGRIYLSPTSEMELIAQQAQPMGVPETELPPKALGFRIQEYGMTKWRDLFTARQLVALTTFSDLIQEALIQIQNDAINAGMLDDQRRLSNGGTGATAYADAVAVYLSMGLSKAADLASTICHWQSNPQHLKLAPTYSRHALAMSWDFGEGNPFSDSSGNFNRQWELISQTLENLPILSSYGAAIQSSATNPTIAKIGNVISTDPPYYDNIPYADLSDFFYIWLRRSMASILPELFGTVVVPKAEELVANPYRHGSKLEAEAFFLDGMTKAMRHLTLQAHPAFPVSIYYAFKLSVR
jgi:putative DNA methylase